MNKTLITLFFAVSYLFSTECVVINEIHYNPSLSLGFEDSDYEFVELYNDSNEDINLNNWVFTNDLSVHVI